MLHFIQVHRTLSVKGVQIYSVETKAWRVSEHFMTHCKVVWLFFLVLCAISPHQGSIESRKIRPKSPRNQWKPFIQLIFSSFHFMFQCSFFLLKGLFTIKYLWPKTAKRSFSFFFEKPVFQSGRERLDCEQALLFRRPNQTSREDVSERRSRDVPVPPHPAFFASRLACLSRVYFSRYPQNGELARRLGGGWGLWARNVAHRTCRKLCVLPTSKQNSVRA